MNYEVVVVGGGIGGLTTAALLAARGVNVCLLERQARVGGCVQSFDHLGYQFEPTFGLYQGWEESGVYDRVFSELPVSAPQVHALSPHYVVRLPDGIDVPVVENLEQFEDYLGTAFPECSKSAIKFYRHIARLPESNPAPDAALPCLDQCSLRFRRFLDVQLQTFVQCIGEVCPPPLAARVLNPLNRYWSIEGGAQTLADALAESLKASGGDLRLNAPVLRLAFDSDRLPVGVDLLNGERVFAGRAIVSNLTVWDTYGKLIGMSRTPAAVSAQLKQLDAWGAYLVYLSLDGSALPRLPARRLLALTDWQENQTYNPEHCQFAFSAAPEADARAPEGKLAVTLSTFTNSEDWFSFHEDHTARDEQDQAVLELIWSRLHAAMPELGDSVEVIETTNPQTLYETTRRKFGMIGRPNQPLAGINESLHLPFPNLFLVGDTVSEGLGLASVVETALGVADAIARKPV